MNAKYKINGAIFLTDKVLSSCRSRTLFEGKVTDLRVSVTTMALERKLNSLGVDIPRTYLKVKVKEYLENLVRK